MAPVAARAQDAPPPSASAAVAPRADDAWLGSVGEERARDAQLLRRRDPSGFLLRSTSTAIGDTTTARTPTVRAILPAVRVTSNSDIPFSLNDGAQWAGRGTSALVRAGAEARWGRVRLVLAPEVAYAANRAFDFQRADVAGASPFASPWRVGDSFIDLPSRFGDRAYVRVTPGQSSLGVRAGAWEAGVGSENAVWGPGRWSALVMSASSEGIPHAFVRTRRPLRSVVGDVEVRWMLGSLTPSTFVDSAVTRSYRSFSGAAVTLRPAAARNLTLGLTRTVVAPIGDRSNPFGHALDALLEWQAPPADPARRLDADQLTGLFARWLFPDDHAEVYAEWARQTTPRSLAELLAAPQEGSALTVGARALRPLGRGPADARYLRFELELTNTEQSIAFRDRPIPAPFYAGRATREGYTQRGQLIGAAIGPGASAQWLATDYVTRAGALGLVLGRVRWANDALYLQTNANFLRHDVSTILGARAQARLPVADVQGEATWARRYNYLFQNGFANPGGRRTVDIANLTFVLAVTPR